MPKPSKQALIDEIIKYIAQGKTRAFVLAKVGKKWQISERTFDRRWTEANEQHADLQRKAKEEADRVYIQTAGEQAKEAFMSEAEAKKQITDIARSNLADYMVIKMVERTPRVEVELQVVIDQLQARIDFEDEFSVLAEYSEQEMAGHITRQNGRKRDMLRHQLELKKNPSATTIIDGPTVWEEVAELDIVRIVKDKAQGKIKSFAHTPSGVKVEMYSADAAQVNILKMHGAFEKDNEQLATKVNIGQPDLSKLNDDELRTLVKLQSKSGISKA